MYLRAWGSVLGVCLCVNILVCRYVCVWVYTYVFKCACVCVPCFACDVCMYCVCTVACACGCAGVFGSGYYAWLCIVL